MVAGGNRAAVAAAPSCHSSWCFPHSNPTYLETLLPHLSDLGILLPDLAYLGIRLVLCCDDILYLFFGVVVMFLCLFDSMSFFKPKERFY